MADVDDGWRQRRAEELFGTSGTIGPVGARPPPRRPTIPPTTVPPAEAPPATTLSTPGPSATVPSATAKPAPVAAPIAPPAPPPSRLYAPLPDTGDTTGSYRAAPAQTYRDPPLRAAVAPATGAAVLPRRTIVWRIAVVALLLAQGGVILWLLVGHRPQVVAPVPPVRSAVAMPSVAVAAAPAVAPPSAPAAPAASAGDRGPGIPPVTPTPDRQQLAPPVGAASEAGADVGSEAAPEPDPLAPPPARAARLRKPAKVAATPAKAAVPPGPLPVRAPRPTAAPASTAAASTSKATAATLKVASAKSAPPPKAASLPAPKAAPVAAPKTTPVPAPKATTAVPTKATPVAKPTAADAEKVAVASGCADQPGGCHAGLDALDRQVEATLVGIDALPNPKIADRARRGEKRFDRRLDHCDDDACRAEAYQARLADLAQLRAKATAAAAKAAAKPLLPVCNPGEYRRHPVHCRESRLRDVRPPFISQ